MKLTKQILVPSLSGFQFGYGMSIISGVLTFMTRAFSLCPMHEACMASIAMLGAMLGSLCAGTVANSIGRKQGLMVSASMFLVGSLLSACAVNELTLLVGRFLVGLGGGLGTIIAPIYLVEITPSENRGASVNLYQVGIALGSLVAYLLGYLMATAGDWRMMLGVGVFPALLQGIFLFFIPESCQGNERSVASHASWKDLIKPIYRSRLFLAITLSVVQALSGASAVFYFAPRIFAQVEFGGEKGPFLATVWIGIVYLVCIWISFKLIDRLGRRKLLMGSLIGMIISLAVVSAAYVIGSAWLNWIAVVGLLINIGAYSIGLGPVPPLVIGEISPTDIRGHLMTLGGFSGWVGNYIVTLTFLPLFKALSLPGTFSLYILCSILGLIILWKKLPETKQKSLDEINNLF